MIPNLAPTGQYAGRVIHKSRTEVVAIHEYSEGDPEGLAFSVDMVSRPIGECPPGIPELIQLDWEQAWAVYQELGNQFRKRGLVP